jgi:arylsulfatase A-like enzyme/tetratricopeptide (TPR) repeat protein
MDQGRRSRALALWLAVVIAACGRPTSPAPPAGAPVLPRGNVLLVTIDTLRADRVGAYGGPAGVTPTLDRLAAEGLRVETVYAHVPLTLPSHAALLTGAYPFVNGVRDNGSFRFDGKLPTLATALKNAGYRTGAFIASFVLDARFGLNAGFDVYDDRYGARPSGGELSLVERPANEVLQSATAWIADTSDQAVSPGQATGTSQPWFAWVHLYDPHDPYDPPEPFKSRFVSDAYAGEIAFADARLGEALDALSRSGRLANTVVVVSADHGESLGEHQERTHGLFAYDSTLRVPLIVWAPPVVRPGVLRGPARLVDVMPTVLDLVGVNPAVPSGQSLWPYVNGTGTIDDNGVYFEALNASLTRNWAPLTGVVAGGLKFIDLPIPELYDLKADPAEMTNLHEARAETAASLARVLSGLRAAGAPPTPVAVDRETEQRLRSLGYVSTPAARPGAKTSGNDDPKTLIGLHNMLDDALAALRGGRPAVAERLLKGIVSRRADFTVAHDRLAQLYRDTGRLPLAVQTLESAARAGVADAASLAALGGYLQEAGNLQRSVEVLEAARALNPSEMDVYEKLGITYTRMGRFDDAHRMLAHMLSVAPNSAPTYNNLGSLYLTERRWNDAIEALSKALAIDPGMANAHNGLGVAYAQQGDLDRAIAEWRRALELRPGLTDARDNLERAQRMRTK